MSLDASPLQNRVLPTGEIVAIPQRGTLMGNRGCLHDDEGIIRHRWKGKRWISCVLDYKDNRVPLRKPGRYTPLFFKDEVSALAAGHRPCALCRREAYRAFVSAVERAKGLNPGSLGADELDAMLHEERTAGREQTDLEAKRAVKMPEGTMISLNGQVFVVMNEALVQWNWQRPGQFRAQDHRVLTPPTMIAALREGYQPKAPKAPSKGDNETR
jgi:hypothetical protein